MSQPRDLKRGIGSLALGAFLAGFGWYEYQSLAEMEETGGTRRVHTLVHMMYSIGGKPAVLGMFLVFAGFAVFNGVQKLRGNAASAAPPR
jgi:hypothetical protein